MTPKPRHVPRFRRHSLLEPKLARREFSWEVTKQLCEDYWEQCDPMNEVKGDRDEIYPDTRMVLQFHQNGNFYRLVFDLFPNDVFPEKLPHAGDIISIFHDGQRPALDCDVIELDGSYDLPTEDIP